MILREIDFQGFRNLFDARLEFARDLNFIIGENGAGKTNLLEAIFYVSLGSSFRAEDECSLISFDRQFLRVGAEADGKKAAVYLDREKKKFMLANNEVPRLSDFIGWIDVTILSIEDIWIIRGAPAKRRYYLDWTLAKIAPVYVASLFEYRKILRQRNKLLQDLNENGDFDLLAIFDEQLIRYGNEIYEKREDVMPELKKYVTQAGAELGLNELGFRYECTCPDMRLNQSVLDRVREKEIAFGKTLVGPQRDDLFLFMDNRPLRAYASEGEERAAAISLKLAEAEMLHDKKKQRPILLLDEVGAELDRHKRETLLKLLKGQVFYASTQSPESLNTLGDRQCCMFGVKRGKIEVSRTN